MIKYAMRLTYESPHYANTFTLNLLAVTRIILSNIQIQNMTNLI